MKEFAEKQQELESARASPAPISTTIFQVPGTVASKESPVVDQEKAQAALQVLVDIGQAAAEALARLRDGQA